MKNKRHPYALLINDIHVSKDNIPEFQKNWDEAIQICNDRSIPEIIVGGDLWQSRSAQSLNVLMAVRFAILKARANDLLITIACGNHDLINQEDCESYNHIFSGYEGVEVIDVFASYDIDTNATLTVMSYFPENGSFASHLKEALQSVDDSEYRVLYIHEGIRGGLAKASDDELPASLFKDFDKVLVGHYHDRKHIEGANIYYIGASRQHNFGEDEYKGYTILYNDGTDEFIQNQVNIRYKTMDILAEEVDDKTVAMLEEMKDDGKYKTKVRVHCQSNEANTIDRQRLQEAGATRIEIVADEIECQEVKSSDLSVKFDKSGLQEEYKNFCHEKEIDVEMGLKYLSKIK